MGVSLRTKLVISFVIIVLITGAVATVIGVHLIGKGIIQQAQDKVRTDLNSAREIYQKEIDETRIIVRLTAERFYIKDSLIKKDFERLNSELAAVRERENLDVLSLTDATGRVLVRARNPQLTGDEQTKCTLVRKVIEQKKAFASAEIIPREELAKESQELVERAHLKFVPTPRAKPTDNTEETAGMMIEAAAPVLDYEGNLLGVLYGGNLVNKNYKIVDKIKETVFLGEVYKGKDIGTATIFQGDLRISTNVHSANGERAIGTRIAADVGEQVLDKGQPWIERAFVVNEWRITAYEPIRDSAGRIIGVLYVGILEEKFVDMEHNAVFWLVGTTIAGVVIALFFAYLLANSITRPITRLADVSQELAKGNFEQKVESNSSDEIGRLGSAFNTMIAAIRERDEKLKAETQQALLHMEKMSSLGQMAAGVAHEVNNPLMGVLTYIRLILKNIKAGKPVSPDDLVRKLETMERETERCTRIIRSLLDFARLTQPSIRPVQIAQVLENSLVMLTHQAEIGNVRISKEYGADAPQVDADSDQLQQVFVNIIMNAVHAMPKGGSLTIAVRRDAAKGLVGIRFADTGDGISPENLKKLFTPFFTTKEPGKGIGLGLAVCYGIIQRHGGDIKVESEPGKGTTFTVWLKEKQAS